MKKLFDSKILLLFFTWRIALFIVAFLAVKIIPSFGGRFPYYNTELISTGLPSWVWGFANFDGVHYLRIIKDGYSSEFTQAFFPLYPLLVKTFYLGFSLLPLSLLLSNLLFLGSLYLFYRLVLLDNDKKIAILSVVLLLLFPTSFYFGSVYSESLFIFLSIASFYLIRKKEYLGAGIYIALASATRLFGLLLIPALLIELYFDLRNRKIKIGDYESIKILIGIILAPLGTLFYMLYLNLNFNNPLYFLTSQPFFGAERSTSIILLPQVLFRYFKMIISTNPFSLPFFNLFLELIFTLVPLIILILGFKRIRLSYWIFTFGCLILPTLTGTLSSMPRYALMSFLILPLICKIGVKYFILISIIFGLLGILLISLFTRGYWIA